MIENLSNLNFSSEVNYMKQDPSSGSITIQLGVLSPDVTTISISHNLGYIPFYQVLSELDQTNTIWIPDVITSTTNSSAFFTPTYPLIDHWIDTINLTIQLDNSSSANTGNIIVYWLIYKDYGSVS